MKTVWRIISNKYLLAGAAFAVWTLFFDQNDWMTQRLRQAELQHLKNNIQYLQGDITRMEKDFTDLTTNDVALERFAREDCRMKRDNEDLYIIDHSAKGSAQ